MTSTSRSATSCAPSTGSASRRPATPPRTATTRSRSPSAETTQRSASTSRPATATTWASKPPGSGRLRGHGVSDRHRQHKPARGLLAVALVRQPSSVHVQDEDSDNKNHDDRRSGEQDDLQKIWPVRRLLLELHTELDAPRADRVPRS